MASFTEQFSVFDRLDINMGYDQIKAKFNANGQYNYVISTSQSSQAAPLYKLVKVGGPL